ncbi:sodium:solute symporter [Clostridia bacterium]|nr:sodium:solute symporter [Clostridia bacterium]
MRFSKEVKIYTGYGFASLGETALFNLMTAYCLYFLTDVAGVSPAMGGMSIMIATTCNSIFIVLIGHISDSIAWKNGRRLPYMNAALPFICISTLLVFNIVDLGTTSTFVYYTAMLLIFWASHSLFVLPYEALGAEIIQGANDRMLLRSHSRFYQSVGNLFGMVIIMPLLKLFGDLGFSDRISWLLMAICVLIPSVISFVITNRTMAPIVKANSPPVPGKISLRILAKDYAEAIRIREFRLLLSVSLIFAIANAFVNSILVYFMKYNLGLPESLKSVMFLVMALSGILFTPIIAVLARRFDKKGAMTGCFILAGVSVIVLGCIGIRSILMLTIFIIVFTIGSSGYWQLMFALVYDIGELNQVKTGKRREGVILSMSKIAYRFAAAVAVLILGLLMTSFGYDPSLPVQPERTGSGFNLILSIIPGILLLVCASLTYVYPISEKVHAHILEQLDQEE